MCIFVRDLSQEEGNQLLRIAQKGANSVEVRRALVILASAQRLKVPEISNLYHLSKVHIRDVIHAFNEYGLESLRRKYGGGRPPTFTAEQRAAIIELAQIPSKMLGLPFTRWSLAKLKETARQRGVVDSISLRPTGRSWMKRTSPTRIRKYGKDRNLKVKKGNPDRLLATYRRTHGARHLLAALDLKEDKLYGHVSESKKHQDVLRFLFKSASTS